MCVVMGEGEGEGEGGAGAFRACRDVKDGCSNQTPMGSKAMQWAKPRPGMLLRCGRFGSGYHDKCMTQLANNMQSHADADSNPVAGPCHTWVWSMQD